MCGSKPLTRYNFCFIHSDGEIVTVEHNFSRRPGVHWPLLVADSQRMNQAEYIYRPGF